MRKRTAARATIVALFAALAALPANSQERPARQFPVVEVYAGFSYANVNLGSQAGVFSPAGRNYSGGQLDTKLNLRKHIGLLFDFAEESGDSAIPGPFGYETHMKLDATQFLVGPEFTSHTQRFGIFAHTLIGLTRTSLNERIGTYTQTIQIYGAPLTVSYPDYVDLAHRTNLAFGAGGGIDRNWKRHFAFRLFQADYIPTRLDGKWESHFRVGTGILVKF
jgi:hypothetical protein